MGKWHSDKTFTAKAFTTAMCERQCKEPLKNKGKRGEKFEGKSFLFGQKLVLVKNAFISPGSPYHLPHGISRSDKETCSGVYSLLCKLVMSVFNEV